MENILNLSPSQAILLWALNAWIFVIFPVLVIKKLNYLTAIMEAQIDQDELED